MKPRVEFHSKGESGNIFHVLALARKAVLTQLKDPMIPEIMTIEVTGCKSYGAALDAIRQYVDLVDLDSGFAVQVEPPVDGVFYYCQKCNLPQTEGVCHGCGGPVEKYVKEVRDGSYG